ncbi:hypothetical protein BsWGS_07614 [Bradybaena similaris]
MPRGNVLNHLRNLVVICGLLIVILSVALVYRALTSKVFRHSHHRSVPAVEKIPRTLYPKHPVRYSDITLHNFKEDLMFADLIPKKSKNYRNKDSITSHHKDVLLDFFASLHPANWKDVAESDDVAFDLKYLLIDCDLESKMSCQQIDNLIVNRRVNQSESKVVELAHKVMVQADGVFQKHELVVKSLIRRYNTACSMQLYNTDICAAMEDYRLLKEILLLTILKHPGIVHMEGYCLRGNRVAVNLNKKGMIIVTEIGIPLTTSILEMSSWSQRVSMALQVAKLLLYLDHCPLGSVRITKLTLSDFVLVRGALVKLVDLDDLELGKKPCTDNSDCHFQGTDLSVQCINKFCSGMNSAVNLFITTQQVLKPMLQSPPGAAEVALVDRLDSFNITTEELVKVLSKFFKQSPPEGPIMVYGTKQMDEMTNGAHRRLGHHIKGETEDEKERADTQPAVSYFTRFEQKNFKSVYDYPCNGSTEYWGCVFTVTSLTAGAKLCLTDDHCQAFVAFSRWPETENFMTVVLKNAVDTNPAVDFKTTLFIKRRQDQILEKGDRMTLQDETQRQDGKSSPTLEAETCLSQVLQVQDSERNIWEKRLMKHLGHGGLREQAWKTMASKQDFRSPVEMVKTEGVGGKFVLSFANSSADSGVKTERIMFISEEGPRVYHKAYAVLYQLDRILGLYHTPPCVSKRLLSDVVKYHNRNVVWNETFRSLITSDWLLSGILVVPPSKDHSDKVLTLEPLRTMTSEIKPFDKSNRLQLEYVLLMWLGRMDRFHDILGYKSHFIHFNADAAFASLGTDMSGYLNHCQFPSQMYEVLQCFLCNAKDQTTSNKVCFLGEEVIRRTRAMFPHEANIFIQSLKEDDLVTAMNSAATSAMHIVNICIKKFGLDYVLY